MTTAANPTCRSGKVSFAGERAALRSANTMRSKCGRTGPSFAYLCTDCGAWHLTQQSPQNKRARAKAAWRAVGHRKRENDHG